MKQAARIFGVVLAIALQTRAAYRISAADQALLEDLSHRSYLYFDQQTNPLTGLTLDRVPARSVSAPVGNASITATGFALSAYCIAQERGWITRAAAEQRTKRTLQFLVHKAPQEHGWFYHFMDARTGQPIARSEVSSIDTAFVVAGALTARACFHDDPEIVALATELSNAVDFPWMMNGSDRFFALGWSPEEGFLKFRWQTYSELLILYVLGIGSPTHPISPAAWDRWSISMTNEGGYTYIGGGPLFIHQYPLAWIDLRDRFAPDAAQATVFRTNYLLNAIVATRAQRQDFIDNLSHCYPGYSENVWGLTSSDSPQGYVDWGDSDLDTRIDGTVAPSAVAGSLMLTPDICLPALRTMIERYGSKIYGRYGLVDAFNPSNGWVGRDVVGIAAGITLLSAENLRTGNVWKWFMSNPEPERALDAVGLIDRKHPLQNYVINMSTRHREWESK